MIISVTVESSLKLFLAPCSKDPDNFIKVTILVLDSLMKNFSFIFCQTWMNIITIISKGAHQSNQKLPKQTIKESSVSSFWRPCVDKVDKIAGVVTLPDENSRRYVQRHVLPKNGGIDIDKRASHSQALQV